MIDTLLICADFFGYAQAIARALEARGRGAVWVNDRPSSDTLTKALVRLSPQIIASKSNSFFEREVARAAEHDIRDVLVIKGEAMSLGMITRMREMLPRARFTLYFWDSFLNMPKGSVNKIALFDRVFSFDPVDVAADPRLVYRPLFFIEEFARTTEVVRDIDILFVGTAHSDRVNVLDRVARSIPPELKFRKVLYARSPLLHSLQRITSRSYRSISESDFIFSPMSKAVVGDLVNRSKVVLDIERSVQTGYTMRTIEMLGASRKVVTTNASILKADFYHPDNQHVIDRMSPQIDLAFIDKPWVEQDPALLLHYSLSGWVDEVLG